jgi:hypothetical protein
MTETKNDEKLSRRWWFALFATVAILLVIGAVTSMPPQNISTAGGQERQYKFSVQPSPDFTLQPPPDYPICRDADGHMPAPYEAIDIASFRTQSAAVPMHPDCWTRRIIVPANWERYFYLSTSTAEYEVIYMDGFRQKIRLDAHLEHACRGIFRFRGEGQIIVTKGKAALADGKVITASEKPEDIQTLALTQ